MATIYVLEGADASGKSTLANYIIGQKKSAYIHATYYAGMEVKKHHETIVEASLLLAKDGNDVVIDRLCFSEYAYGKVFRDGQSYDVKEFWDKFIKAANDSNIDIKLVLCRPQVSNFGEEDREEMFDSMVGINEAYDEILPAGRYFTFDYQNEALTSILKRIDGKEIDNE